MIKVIRFVYASKWWVTWHTFWCIYFNFRSDDPFVSQWWFLRSVASRLQFDVSYVTWTFNSQNKLQETIERFFDCITWSIIPLSKGMIKLDPLCNVKWFELSNEEFHSKLEEKTYRNEFVLPGYFLTFS